MVRSKKPGKQKPTETPKGKSTKAKWNPALCEKVYHLALLGLTNKEMALLLDLSISTFEKYERVKPAFAQAIREGKSQADSRVAESLYHAAIGYSHMDTYIAVVQGKVEKVPIRKHYPPNITAGIFWLKNRTRHQENPWADVHRTEHTGKDGNPIETSSFNKGMEMDLSDFTNDELNLMRSMQVKMQPKQKLKKDE